MNEDVEVVHYAITAMVELSKDYDSKLQTFERTYAAAPEDPVVLDEYCDFMEEYLQQGLLEKQVNICRESVHTASSEEDQNRYEFPQLFVSGRQFNEA